MVLSILIGVRDGRATIEECLSSLEPQLDARVEVIVADGSRDGTAELVDAHFPWVRLLRREPMNGAQLRREAFAASNGRLIALAEPHVTFAPGWVSAALAVERHGAAAVGGAVAPGRRRVRGIGPWAAFLCEYADFLPPLAAGPTVLTPGNNVVYRRAALETSDLRGGLAKTWVNADLAKRGATFWADPSLLVQHERPYEFSTFLSKRFHYGRCYGATRARGRPRMRLIRAASTPLLPALFTWRVIRAIMPKPRYLGRLVLSQPLLLLFHTWWAVGEACGYLAGPGDSCARVY
ncbi:MAG: glycosyltransferase [Chloroflexota bacterium]|nr:glycosyltransferase [Chloroflexota bacterium]